jgi:uncharacterized RDD family membrane protein YckC
MSDHSVTPAKARFVPRVLAGLLDIAILSYLLHLTYGAFAYFIDQRDIHVSAPLTVVNFIAALFLFSIYALKTHSTPGKQVMGLTFSKSNQPTTLWTYFFRMTILYLLGPINIVLAAIGKPHLGERASGLSVITAQQRSIPECLARALLSFAGIFLIGSVLAYYHPFYYASMKGLQAHVQKVLEGPDSEEKKLIQQALSQSDRTVDDLVDIRSGVMTRYRNGKKEGTYKTYEFEWHTWGYRYWTSINSEMPSE